MAMDVRSPTIEQFVKALGVAPERIRAMERIFLTVAATEVLVEAKDSARKIAGRRGGRSVEAKSSVDIRSAGPGVLRYGGKPWDMGAEFGSYQYRQFDRWRGNDDDAGYFLWPALRKFRDDKLVKKWLLEVWPVIHEAFPE